ncbi:sensor histidine kinase [Micromonosporaceae bacterium Da 78-11]
MTALASPAGADLRFAAASRYRSLVERDDIVTVISHELRTPLAVIRGNLELLTELAAAAPAPFRRRLDALSRNTSRLSNTVENLMLAIDQHPTGTPQVGDLAAVLTVAAGQVAQPAAGFVLDVPAEPVWVVGDPGLLQVAVDQLLRNAVTHGGGDQLVSVSLRHRPRPTIEIRDHGPGLDPAEQEQLAIAFYRGDRARHDEKPGLGLGLTISRRVVDAHGGQLEIDNAPGGGVVARIVLPSYS